VKHACSHKRTEERQGRPVLPTTCLAFPSLKDSKYERQASTKAEKEIKENKVMEKGIKELIRRNNRKSYLRGFATVTGQSAYSGM
jgi:hypothetical protein